MVVSLSVVVAVVLGTVAWSLLGPRAELAAVPGTSTSTGTVAAFPPRDDFRGARPDGRWVLYNRTLVSGGEWSSGQVRTLDGELQILGQGSDPTGAGNRSGGLCWCGPGGDQLYGVWQVKVRIDPGRGYGQTIGLWPASEDGAADGVITIMNVISGERDSSWQALRPPGGVSTGVGTDGDFTRWHVFTAEWRRDFVTIAVDGTTVFDSRTDAVGLAVPHTPMHLYLQQDIGPTEFLPAPDERTPERVAMYVDWVSYSP
jgi:hypothetical protein